MKKNKKKYGLDLEKQQNELSEEDHIFGGASSPCLAQIPMMERENYLPEGELQNIGEEKMDCATRSPLNKLELKLNYLIKNNLLLPENIKWFIEKGYVTENGVELSDSFNSTLSGTTKRGNSLKAPLQSIKNDGVIPKSMLPQAYTWEKHHYRGRITQEMIDLGKEFKERITVRYEKVYEQDYENLIKKDLLGVAGYAWPVLKNGEYGKVSYTPNHAFMIFLPMYFAFDNYEEGSGEFIKKLSYNYDFLDYGYRLYILSQQLPKSKCWLINLFRGLS